MLYEAAIPLKLIEALCDVLEEPDVWLAAPNSNFGGRRPVDLVETPDVQLIWDWIESVKLGLYS